MFRLPKQPMPGARRCGRGRVTLAAEFEASAGATGVAERISLRASVFEPGVVHTDSNAQKSASRPIGTLTESSSRKTEFGR